MDDWMDMALSIVQLGGGVGSTVMSYFLGFLNQHYGLNGCFIAYAGVLAQTIWCAALLKPKQVTTETDDDTRVIGSVTTKIKAILQQFSCICRNKAFLCNTMGVVLQMASSTIPTMLLVDYCMEIGYGHDTGVFMIVIMNGAGLFGRILPGFLKMIPHISSFTTNVVITVIGGAAITAMPFTHEYAVNVVLVSLIGLSYNIASTLYAINTAKLVPTSDYPTAFGIMTTLFGIAMSFTPPIAGNNSHYIFT